MVTGTAGKVKVITMKHSDHSENVKAQVRRLSAKKAAASAALCLTLLAVGAVSVFAFTGENRITTDENAVRAVTTASQNNAEDTLIAEEYEEAEEDAEYSETVTWWKAGVEDYEFNDVTSAAAAKKKTTTTTKKTAAAKKSEKTTTAAATTKAATTKKKTTKKVAVEDVSGLKVYSTAIVNVRTGAGTDYDKLATLMPDTEVSVTGKTSDGWYRIDYNGQTGYVSAEYFTDVKPVTTTAKKTTTKAATTTAAKKAETKAQTTTTTAAETKAKKSEKTTTTTTTAAKAAKNSGTVSYTDEEYEMLCYVLQGEVGSCSEASKIAVANVILNRVKDSRFANSISGVLTAPNQFTAISSYYSKTNSPSQNTRDCALRALQGEDNSNGAVYYYSPRYCGGATAAWFESLTFCMELDGQRYFK